jgi:hypothetical protein
MHRSCGRRRVQTEEGKTCAYMSGHFDLILGTVLSMASNKISSTSPVSSVKIAQLFLTRGAEAYTAGVLEAD